MKDTNTHLPLYRTVNLPGLGLVQVPDTVTDAEVLTQVLGEDAAATVQKKTKKMP